MSEMVNVPARTVPYLAVPLSWGFAHRTPRPIPDGVLPYRVAL